MHWNLTLAHTCLVIKVNLILPADSRVTNQLGKYVNIAIVNQIISYIEHLYFLKSLVVYIVR